MLINKKITFFKYYKLSAIEISSIADNLIVIYKVKNGIFYKWSKVTYLAGELQSFDYLEKDNCYIIISEPNSSYEIDIGLNDKDFEFIVDKTQLCVYKGQDLNIETFKDNLSSAYKISNSGNNYLKWSKSGFDSGELQGFDFFIDDSFYILISNNPSYVFWPPLNFNKSQLNNNNNINWGLLEHIK